MREMIVYSRRRRTTQISPSLSSSHTPIKPHRSSSHHSSLVWCNLGKQEAVNELDEYTREADVALDFLTMETLKHGQHQNPTSVDLMFEPGKVEEITSSGAKRVRCLYSPQNANSSKEDDSSLKPGLAEWAECDSSASNLHGANSDQVSESSGIDKRKDLNLKGQIKNTNDQHSVDVEIKDQKETVAYLDIEVEKISQSALVDVELTVQANYRPENIPFACLTSEAYGSAILGYPLEIKAITDGSETFLLSEKNVAHKLFGDKGRRPHQLVWRTSKRTPVCYVTNSLLPSISKNVQAKQAGENAQDRIPPVIENGVVTKEKSFVKLLKNPKQISQGKTASSQSCVPVELIFSKMLAAVYHVQP